MAEAKLLPPEPAQGWSTAPVSGFAMLRVLIGSRLRSQARYRASLGTDLVTQAVMVITEFAELYVMLTHAPLLGGMSLPQVGLVYAASALAFGFADLAVGSLDTTNNLVREGLLETLLIRPTALLTQLITQEVQLHRLGRFGTGLVAYPVMLYFNHIDWTPAKVALAIIAPLGGTLIFCAIFLWAGCFVMVVLDGGQAANAITYGGKYASSVPGAALFTPIRVFFTFIVPTLASAWIPMAVLTGAPLPSDTPSWLAWCGPLFGMAMIGLGLLAWVRAVRHYTGAGG